MSAQYRFKKRLPYFIYTAVFMSLLWASISYAEPASSCSLRFGVVPHYSLEKILANWSPLVRKIEKRTGCYIEIETHQDIEDFANAVYAGEYDLAYLNPYHAFRAYIYQGYEPIIRDRESMTGIVVANKNDRDVTLQDLAYEQIGLPSQTALGATLMNAFMLKRDHNITINPRFVKTHESGYLFVAKGLLRFAGGVYHTYEAMPLPVKSRLRIVYETEPMPGHPLIVHPDVSEEIREGIMSVFLSTESSDHDDFVRVKIDNPVKANIDEYARMFEEEFLVFAQKFKDQ